ncbi:SDR family oxidoreductase [Methylobacterium phyllosphaerae]
MDEALAAGQAVELAPMRVNTVMRDATEAPPWTRMPEAHRRALFASVAGRLRARRIGQPEDIANAILFLAKTPFATGSTMRVDGGCVIG